MAFQRKKRAAIGVKAPYPRFIEPALATSVDKVPSGASWIHEIKFDGYRVQVHLRDAAVKVFTRRGNDWTNRFKKIASDAWHVNAGSAMLRTNGTADFWPRLRPTRARRGFSITPPTIRRVSSSCTSG